MTTLGTGVMTGLLGNYRGCLRRLPLQVPGTEQNIFRDFPDVFSEEYRLDAEECAKAMQAKSRDPWMVGYFLRNEPAWAFVDNLVIGMRFFIIL